MGITYRDAGVDIDEGNRFVGSIREMVDATRVDGVLSGLGGFGALFKLDINKYKEPVLVSGTDGVGTKLKVAFMAGRHDTVGIDLVAMCVNDILTSGATPLFFLDYLATGKLKVEDMVQVVKGITDGCRQAGVALIGGETAELPGFYKKSEYDLAGFCVGVVDRADIIDGSSISEGDCLIGLGSSGLHSNGYSLARKVIFDVAGKAINDRLLNSTVADLLLSPTRIYVKPVLRLMETVRVKAMAHITGGGICENLIRTIPAGYGCSIDESSWDVPELFRYIQEEGKIEDKELYRAFNMGIGMILVIGPSDVDRAVESLKDSGEKVFLLGHVERGDKKVVIR